MYRRRGGIRCHATEWRVTVLLLSMVVVGGSIPPAVAETGVPDSITQALKDADWQKVVDEVGKLDVKDADVPLRMVTVHACLATNRSEKSRPLLSSPLEPDGEQAAWSKWTDAFVLANPKSAMSQYLRADSLARSGELANAIHGLNKAIETDDRFSLAYTARGIMRTLQGGEGLSDALADLVTATQLAPESAYAWSALGFHWMVAKVPDEAQKTYTRALELDPGMGEAYIGRACASLGLGEFEEALDDLEKASLSSPALSDLASLNREGVLATANLLLNKIAEYDDPEKPGTTVQTSFRVSEVMVDGRAVPVYIVSPSEDYQANRASVAAIVKDLSARTGRPVSDASLLMHGHGWGSAGTDHKVFAARMAHAGGMDAVVVLDFPEMRGNVSPESSRAARIVGQAKAAFSWGGVSNTSARKMASFGRAYNDETGKALNASLTSGAAEAFVKQGLLPGLQVPRYNEVVLTAYPFHDLLGFRDVRVSESLQRNSARITNLFTARSNWSNTLDGDQSKVTNLRVIAGGRGIRHREFTSETVNGGLNPVFAIASAVYRGRPSTEVTKAADLVGRASPVEIRAGNVKWVEEPFWHFGPMDKVIDPSVFSGAKYFEAPSTPEVRAPGRSDTKIVHDVVITPFRYLQRIEAFDTLVGMAGAASPRKVEVPDTLGPLDDKPLFVRHAELLEGAYRIRISDDQRWMMYVPDPKLDLTGRMVNPDLMDTSNWRALTADEAMDRLQPSMRLQTQTRGGPTEFHAAAFENLTGYRWGPQMVLLNPGVDRVSKWVQVARDEPTHEVTFTLPLSNSMGMSGTEGPRVHTTVRDFLKGNIPKDRLEVSLENEYNATRQFRAMTGESIEFRHWVDKGPVNTAANNGRTAFKDWIDRSPRDTASPVLPFQNIGASPEGVGRIQDVWYRKVNTNNDLDGTFADATTWAKRTGSRDISLVYNDAGRSRAEDLAKRLEVAGYTTVLRRDESLSMSTMTSIGMGRGEMGRPVMVMAMDGKASAGGSDALDRKRWIVNSTEDLASIPKLARDIASGVRNSIGVIGSGDLRSSVLSMQLHDQGIDAYRIPSVAVRVPEVMSQLRNGGQIAVEPPTGHSYRLGDNVAPIGTSPASTSGISMKLPETDYDWRNVTPSLKLRGFQDYHPAKPANLPGGVSTKEFAKAWVDTGDWPVWVCAPGDYGAPVSLMREVK